MRAPILIAGTALALAGCRNTDQVDNTRNLDENLAAENIVSNDVTAIDAVTGDAANMAADVDYGNLVDNRTDNAIESGNASVGARRPERSRASEAPAEAAASDNQADAPANTAE